MSIVRKFTDTFQYSQYPHEVEFLLSFCLIGNGYTEMFNYLPKSSGRK